MSMHLDGYESTASVQAKRNKEKDAKKREKKRKRSEQHSGHNSPTKKHQSKHLARDSRTIDEAFKPPEIAEVSPFFEQTSSLYLPLSPICQQYPLQGVCAEHISPLILTYYPPLNGVLMSYSNPKLSARPPESLNDEEESPVLAQSVNEYAVSFVWVTANFLLFRPQRGSRVEGWINLQNEGNIGLVCFNFFNASIERRRLPKDWKWIRGGTSSLGARKSTPLDGSQDQEEAPQVNGFGDGDGHFVNGRDERVEGSLTFTVKDMEASRSSDREHAFLSIEGTLLSSLQEKELREQDFIRMQNRSSNKPGAGKDTDHTMTGAIADGHVDGASDIEPRSKMKHRMAY